jgi:hypothetical protein
VPIASRPRQQPSGRYGAPAPAPAGGLGTAPSLNIRTAIGAVDDPLERGKKLAATVNRNVDVLEWEYSHRQIDEAAYQAGRLLKRAYERLPTAAGRIELARRRPDRPDRGAERQGRPAPRRHEGVERLEGQAAKVVGWSGVALLRLVLRDGLTFKDITLRAAAKGSRASVPRWPTASAGSWPRSRRAGRRRGRIADIIYGPLPPGHSVRYWHPQKFPRPAALLAGAFLLSAP